MQGQLLFPLEVGAGGSGHRAQPPGPGCPPAPRLAPDILPCWAFLPSWPPSAHSLSPLVLWPLLTLAAAHGLLVLSRAESTYASGLTSDVTSSREAFLTPTPADSQAALPG